MLRCALPLSVALTVLCGGEIALAARTTTPVAGDVRAVAFLGDALAIAHLPSRGGLTVERFVAGSPPQPLLGTTLRDADDQVQLAGSAEALAIGLQADADERFGPSRVFVGPPSGPVREVATCAAGLLAPPVAVSGARIAWREGGCGDPAAGPTAIVPASIVIGAADPAVAPARVALDPAVLPVSLVLAGAGGMVGALRPSFFALDSEVRSFSPLGVGATLLSERGGIASPVGGLADGTRVFALSRLDGGDGDRVAMCPNTLFTIAADAPERRALPTGGCPIDADVPTGPSSARIAADRVYARVSDLSRSGSVHPPRVSLVSVRGDGGDRRVHVSGSYRPPLGFAAEGDRVAYWHRRCADAATDVVLDGDAQSEGGAAIASCRASVLTRAARVLGGRIAVRLRCPSGCRGAASDAAGARPRRLREFAFAPGTHVLRLSLSRAMRRRARLRLELAVENGPARLAVIRLRR